MLPPSAGVGAVGVDRRAAAPPGERAPGAGCTAYHRGGRLLHRVRQQHSHDHHLSARPGGAGEGPYRVLGWEGSIPPNTGSPVSSLILGAPRGPQLSSFLSKMHKSVRTMIFLILFFFSKKCINSEYFQSTPEGLLWEKQPVVT